MAAKSKPAAEKQVRPTQNAATKQVPSKATIKKVSPAAPTKKAGKYRRNEIIPMDRIRMIQDAIQKRDLEEREFLQVDDLR
jgi:hypothetical protein